MKKTRCGGKEFDYKIKKTAVYQQKKEMTEELTKKLGSLQRNISRKNWTSGRRDRTLSLPGAAEVITRRTKNGMTSGKRMFYNTG